MGASDPAWSAEWFQSALDSITDLVLIKGDRSKLLWANRAFRECYGMSNQQLQDLIDAPHSDPDDTVQYVKDDHQVFTSGESLDIPAEPITDVKGNILFYHTVKHPVFDDAGRVVRTIGVSRRVQSQSLVDEWSQARSKKKSSLSELRALVQHLPTAVAMLDVKQRFLCHSEAWRLLVNYSGAELHGQFYDESFEGRLALSEHIASVIDESTPRRLEALAVDVGGQKRLCDVDVHPWFLPQGGVGGAIVLAHDVTQLRGSELSLQQANDELMQFNYRVSHDLLAPLSTMRGYLSICQEELDRNPEMVASLHQKLITNVEQLSGLVQDVLNLARSDVRSEAYAEVVLEALVSEVFDSQADALERAGLKTDVKLGCKRMVTSRFRLRQVLVNLLSNAIKYHDPEREERCVTLTIEEQRETITIEFVDNGIGIDAHHVSGVFDLFVRASSKHTGSGLGLYLVHKHIARLGGTVAVTSNRNPTVFTITLPKNRTIVGAAAAKEEAH